MLKQIRLEYSRPTKWCIVMPNFKKYLHTLNLLDCQYIFLNNNLFLKGMPEFF